MTRRKKVNRNCPQGNTDNGTTTQTLNQYVLNMIEELKETKRVICMTRNINKDTLEKGNKF